MEETAVMHMKQSHAKKQVRSSEHNKGRKTQEVYSIIKNTEFAMVFSTVYSAYMWPVNPFTALSTLITGQYAYKLGTAYMQVDT